MRIGVLVQSLFWPAIAAILKGLALVFDGYSLIRKALSAKRDSGETSVHTENADFELTFATTEA